MYQLVREGGDVNVRIIRKFGQGRKWMEDADLVDTSKVRETFNGVYPENLVKFRAISGDSSDRLKGYYRFRKSNAAIIAENFDYSVEKKGFVLKTGIQRGLIYTISGKRGKDFDENVMRFNTEKKHSTK